MKIERTMKPASAALPLSWLLGLAVFLTGCASSDRSSLDAEATIALQELYADSPDAAELGKQAKAILIFPSVIKGGFIIGGHHGNGVLRMGGQTAGYYKVVAGSYGLQAGVQRLSFALFFMNDSALDYLRKSHGLEVGSGPSFAIGNVGMARSFTTTTLRKDIYAFSFAQQGLMAGLGLQGSKISEINPR